MVLKVMVVYLTNGLRKMLFAIDWTGGSFDSTKISGKAKVGVISWPYWICNDLGWTCNTVAKQTLYGNGTRGVLRIVGNLCE